MKRVFFAFNEVPLQIPENWDLNRYSGNARSGTLDLDDGRRAVLHAEWDRLGRHDRDRLVRGLLQSEGLKEPRERLDLSPEVTFLDLRTEGKNLTAAVVRQPDRDRWVAVRLPGAKGHLRDGLGALTRPLREPAPEEQRRWRFFGSDFRLPEGFLLTEAALQPGCMRLEFEAKNRFVILFDVALLERLEAEGLPAAARRLLQGSLRKRFRWQEKTLSETPEGPAAFHVALRLRRRWLERLGRRLMGAWRIRLEAIPQRARNRLALLIFDHRHPDETARLDDLRESLVAAETPS
jgi:hypothetical protein